VTDVAIGSTRQKVEVGMGVRVGLAVGVAEAVEVGVALRAAEVTVPATMVEAAE